MERSLVFEILTSILFLAGGLFFLWVCNHLYKYWEAEHEARAKKKRPPQISEPLFLIEENESLRFPYSVFFPPSIGYQVYWKDPKGERSGYYIISKILYDKDGKVNYAEPFGIYPCKKDSHDEILAWADDLIFTH